MLSKLRGMAKSDLLIKEVGWGSEKDPKLKTEYFESRPKLKVLTKAP